MGLRHGETQGLLWQNANVSTTATYYIKTAADDVRKAMTKLEDHISAQTPSDTDRTLESNLTAEPSTLQQPLKYLVT